MKICEYTQKPIFRTLGESKKLVVVDNKVTFGEEGEVFDKLKEPKR